MNKVDANTDLLLKRYKNLTELSSTTNKSDDSDTEETHRDGSGRNQPDSTNLNLIATSTLSIESNASNIIRLLEELLLLTRSLKESWLLNRLPNSISELDAHYNEKTINSYEKQNEVLSGMINELIDRISYVDYISDEE